MFSSGVLILIDFEFYSSYLQNGVTVYMVVLALMHSPHLSALVCTCFSGVYATLCSCGRSRNS